MNLKSYQDLKSDNLIRIEGEIYETKAKSGWMTSEVIGGKDVVDLSLELDEDFWEAIDVSSKIFKDGTGKSNVLDREIDDLRKWMSEVL